MYNVVIILIVIAAVLMTLIVLIQESKGGGLASGFSSSNQIMGVRKTTDVIEKTTWGLAIAMVLLSVASAYLLPSQIADTSVVMKPEATQMALPTLPQQAPEGTTAAPAAATAAEAPAAAPAEKSAK